MRFRLVHSLALLLLATVATAVVAMGVMMALNLRHGFQGYLIERDLDQLHRLATVVETRVANNTDDLAQLQQGRIRMREFLDALAEVQGVPANTASYHGPVSGQRERPLGRPDDRLPNEQRGPGDGGFGNRVALYDLTHTWLTGRRLPIGTAAVVELPVVVQGKQIAWLCMLQARPVPDAVEQKFLRSQYRGILVVAAGLMSLVLLGAWLFARRWTRPLHEIQAATARIANGELNVRLTTTRRDELGDVMRNVNTMAAGLQRLEQSRRRWLADISHELRTPLTVVRGEIEALLDGIRPLTQDALLSLRDEVLTLGRLVNDLHTLAMSDLQSLPCHFDQVDATSFLTTLLDKFALRAEPQQLTVACDISPLRGVIATWDTVRLEQLFTNLLENSLRYTDAPGRIMVTTSLRDSMVTICIDDSAPGVPDDTLPRLFEPLFRVDAARTRRADASGGSGLGLAICQAIVQAHGGSIIAESSALGGVRIAVSLPCTQLIHP